MAALKLLANLKGADGSTTWSDVTDKPAYIGAGSSAAAALTAIGGASLGDALVLVQRDMTAPYAWPNRIAGAGHVLWVDITDQPPSDPPQLLVGSDLILDPGWA